MLAALNRLGVKLFVSTALVVVVALGGALFLTKRRADAAARESIARALDATRSAIQGTLDARQHALEQSLGILTIQTAYIARFQSAGRNDLVDMADEFQLQSGASWVRLLDAEGVVQSYSADHGSYGDMLAGGSLVDGALAGDRTRGMFIDVGPDGEDLLYQAVGVPIQAPHGPVLGVLLAGLAIDSSFLRQLKAQTSSEIVFFTLDTLGRPRPALSTLPADVDVGASMQGMAMDSAVSDSSHVELVAAGERWVGTMGALTSAAGAPLGGYVGLRSRAQELAAYTALRSSAGQAFLVGLVIALLSSLLIARTITGPVRRLVQATRDVREGRYSGEIVVGTRDEVGELADAFRRMVSELKEKQELVELLSGGAASTVQMTPGDLRLVTSAPTPAPRPSALGITLAPGQVLANRYEVKEVLGAGGMGVVFRAWDRELQEAVAIKTLKPEAMDATGVERFKQEIRLARKISHRNVVRTHDLGEADGMLFITMEYVEGTSLEKLLRQRHKLPVGVALTVSKQLCRALEAAHEQGVIHRDIKPQNIVVDPTGLVKVMDFGIARLTAARQQDSKGLTAVGSVVGTPQYMSPEQLMGQELDPRSDLYSAGAVMFEIVTGRVVFDAPNVPALIVKQLEEAPADPRTLNPTIPDDLAQVILKSLAKAPEARWSSATELIEALDEVEG